MMRYSCQLELRRAQLTLRQLKLDYERNPDCAIMEKLDRFEKEITLLESLIESGTDIGPVNI